MKNQKTETSVVTIKGQVVIPSRIRRKFGIKNGTKIYFYDEGDKIKMIPITEELIKANFGILNNESKTSTGTGSENVGDNK